MTEGKEGELQEGPPINPTEKYLESSPSEFRAYLKDLGPDTKVSINIDMENAPEFNWLQRLMTETPGQVEFNIRATDEEYESYKATIFSIRHGVNRIKI